MKPIQNEHMRIAVNCCIIMGLIILFMAAGKTGSTADSDHPVGAYILELCTFEDNDVELMGRHKNMAKDVMMWASRDEVIFRAITALNMSNAIEKIYLDDMHFKVAMARTMDKFPLMVEHINEEPNSGYAMLIIYSALKHMQLREPIPDEDVSKGFSEILPQPAKRNRFCIPIAR